MTSGCCHRLLFGPGGRFGLPVVRRHGPKASLAAMSDWPAPQPLTDPVTDRTAARAAEGDPAVDDVRRTDLAEGACLVAIAFGDPLYAQEALLAALRLKARGKLDVDDAAIVSRAGDKVRIQQTRDLNTVDGAMSGGWWGLLAGLFLANPLVGGALGAALGGLWAKLRDVGISDEEMRHLGESLEPDEAALFLLLKGGHRWHAFAEAQRFPGRILHTTLGAEDAEALQTNLGSGVQIL